MKKIFMLLMSCFMAIAVNAAELNIYASGLKSGDVNGTQVEIQYFLNAPATTLSVNIMNGETVVKTIDLIDATLLTKGAHTTTIDLSGIANGTYTWTMTAAAAASTTELAASTTKTFTTPRGVCVDNFTESKHFGNIYVSDPVGKVSDGAGIWMYNAGLEDFSGQGDTPWLDGKFNPVAASPMRPSVGEDGLVFIADWGDTNPNIWVFDPAAPSIEKKVFGGASYDNNGIASTSDNVVIHGSIASCYVKGVGAERVLYTIDEDVKTDGKMCIYRYNIGNMDTPYEAAPSGVFYANEKNYLQNANVKLIPEKNGGLWIAQHRWTDNASIPSLLHLADTIDFNSKGMFGDINNRSSVALNVTEDKIAVLDWDEIKIFNLSKDNVGLPVLTLSETIASVTTNGTTYDIAFDYADNLYVIANGKALNVYAVGKTANTTTVPAASTYKLTIGASGLNANPMDAVRIHAANGRLSVDAGNIALTDYAVYSNDGRMLTSQKVNAQQLNIPIDNLSAGVYFIRLASGKGMVTKKFIKK